MPASKCLYCHVTSYHTYCYHQEAIYEGKKQKHVRAIFLLGKKPSRATPVRILSVSREDLFDPFVL